MTPFCRTACSIGASAGTPGLGMIKSCSRKVFSRWPPNSMWTPAVRNELIASPISFSTRASVAVTLAPRAAQNCAVATPVLASPTTSTRLPRNSNGFAISIAKPSAQIVPLPQFQRRQRKQRKNQRSNPKSHNYLRLAPAHQFKMMMDGRHSKNALPPQLERSHLQDHGKRFNHKNSADKKEQNLLLDDHGNGAQRPTERERTNIAHEDLRGVGVVPKETKRSTDKRAAKHGEFADARDVLNLKVGSPARVAAHVRSEEHT